MANVRLARRKCKRTLHNSLKSSRSLSVPSAASLETLEQGIVAASGRLQQATRDRPQVRQKIADYLHQEEGEQTSRMAMAIVANAITFHSIIAGTHNVQTVDELRASTGILPKGAVLREWARILRDINYWPIFHIARSRRRLGHSVAATF